MRRHKSEPDVILSAIQEYMDGQALQRIIAGPMEGFWGFLKREWYNL